MAIAPMNATAGTMVVHDATVTPDMQGPSNAAPVPPGGAPAAAPVTTVELVAPPSDTSAGVDLIVDGVIGGGPSWSALGGAFEVLLGGSVVGGGPSLPGAPGISTEILGGGLVGGTEVASPPQVILGDLTIGGSAGSAFTVFAPTATAAPAVTIPAPAFTAAAPTFTATATTSTAETAAERERRLAQSRSVV